MEISLRREKLYCPLVHSVIPIFGFSNRFEKPSQGGETRQQKLNSTLRYPPRTSSLLSFSVSGHSSFITFARTRGEPLLIHLPAPYPTTTKHSYLEKGVRGCPSSYRLLSHRLVQMSIYIPVSIVYRSVCDCYCQQHFSGRSNMVR